jgi:hemoglobin
MIPLEYIILFMLIVIAVPLIISFSKKSNFGNVTNTKKSLYDRLGGIYNIAAVVNHFSDALIDNPIVGKSSPNPYLRNWSNNSLDRLPGLKWMRTLWLASLAGGPYKYVPTKPGKCPFSLENAHKDLQISPAEFDAVGQELANSLDYFHVPAKEKAEVLAAFSAHKSEVNTGYDIAHNLPVTKPKC